jgi:hypothetical protein
MKVSFSHLKILVIFGTVLFWPAINTLADETSRVSTGMIIPIIQSMDISPGSFVFPDITSSDLDKGAIEALNTATATVSSNVPWQVTIQSEDPDMGNVEDTIKPLSDFLWKKSGDADYTAITTSGQVINSNSEYADHQKTSLDYKMIVGWTRDKPGTYGLTLRFTMSTLE